MDICWIELYKFGNNIKLLNYLSPENTHYNFVSDLKRIRLNFFATLEVIVRVYGKFYAKLCKS